MSKVLKTFLLTLILVCVCCVGPVVATSENNQIYSSEQAAIAAELQRLRESNAAPGTYVVPVWFERDGRTITAEARVTITGAHTVVVGVFAIDAADATVTIAQAQTFHAEDWIAITGARAWRTDTNEAEPITGVDASRVLTSVGIYPIVFFANGIETTVKIRVGNSDGAGFYNETGYFEEQLDVHAEWSGFEFSAYAILQISLLFMLLLPLAILIIQYLYTSKMVKRLIQLVLKK